jgi:hypothetical protein
VVLRKMAPVFDIDEQLRYVVGYGIDITAIKLSKDILQQNNLFQATLMDLATKYINLPIEKMDVTINESLSQLGNFVHVDRVYIFTYDHKTKTASNTYEWCAEGIGPQIDNLQFIPFSSIPFWIETHAKGDEIIIEKTTELPDGTVKEMLLEQDIKSVFALPLMKGNKCIGFVGFDAVLNYRIFYEDEKDLLRLFGKMLVNLEIQTNFLKQISAKTEEIQNMNTDLELIVAEKTKRNIELSKSITDQEKLVTIGEIASGIAHDLNTPLGAIKIGAESIRYTLSELLKNIIWKCSEEQIKFACERSAQKQGELFLLAKNFLGLENIDAVRLQAIDRLGVDLRISSGDFTDEYRIGFRHKVSSAEDAKSELMKLFQESWERDQGFFYNDKLPPFTKYAEDILREQKKM